MARESQNQNSNVVPMSADKPRRRSAGGAGGSGINLFRGKYAPEAFIIPGQDQNGNSVRVWCRIVPLLDRAIDILVFSKKFPFKSKGDLVRFCIKRGVEALEEMEPVRDSVTAQVDAMFAVLRDEQANHEFMTVFNTMGATVGMHIQAHAMGEARRVVSEMRGIIMKMREGYWRTRYLKEMDDKFGHLLQGSLIVGASLGQQVDGGPDNSIDEDDGTDYDE